MICKKIDLYEYFSVPREGRTGGVLTTYAREKYTEIKEKIRPAMLVIPGGGYEMVSERECETIALRFVQAGYSAFTLLYSVKTPYPVPLVEAAMATAYIRENAAEYEVDPAHVAAVGFSAGGHLVGMLATMFGEKCVKDALGKRAKLVRPDAVLLSYPVVTAEEGVANDFTMQNISGGDRALRRALSVETHVTKESSPAFIWHTYSDDCVFVENSVLLFGAYRKCGVPCELHIFERGWHGLGEVGFEVQNEELPPEVKRDAAWTELALSFLKMHGFEIRVG